MNSILQGTPNSTLKTVWVKGKIIFVYIFGKNQRKLFCTYF